MQITFKTKAKTAYNPDDSIAFRYVTVPKLTRSHCNMQEFRNSRAFGSLANSDLFPAILGRIRKNLNIGEFIRLDDIPACVTIDESWFLAVVTVTVPDDRSLITG